MSESSLRNDLDHVLINQEEIAAAVRKLGQQIT